MLTGFPSKVDENVENISIYHGKMLKKARIEKMQNRMLIYIYIRKPLIISNLNS